MKGIDYVEADEKAYELLDPGYFDGLENFEIIGGSDSTFKCQFWCNINWFKQVSQFYPNYIIIDCSDLGLCYNGGYDPNCFTVRDQTLLVRPPKDCRYKNKTITYRLSDGKYSFVISRPFDSGIICGGTRQPGNTDSKPDMNAKEELISIALTRFPELVIFENGKPTLDVKKINVGFRPMRIGGVRLEKEIVNGTKFIHCYGFGSSGFEMSWGAAEVVLKLVTNILSNL